jgi:hypothetical protein
MPKDHMFTSLWIDASRFLLFQNNENKDVETDITPNLSISGDECVT